MTSPARALLALLLGAAVVLGLLLWADPAPAPRALLVGALAVQLALALLSAVEVLVWLLAGAGERP